MEFTPHRPVAGRASDEVVADRKFHSFLRIPPFNQLMPSNLGVRFAYSHHLVGANPSHFICISTREEVLLDRSMPFISPPPPLPIVPPRDRLKNFDSAVQHYGTFFSGYPWQMFGCGTYRSYATLEQAKPRLVVYFDRLRKSIKAPIAYLAVAERRISGLGHPAIPLHWHFVASAPPQYTTTVLHNARSFWGKHYGNAKIDPYDARCSGAHYLAKLAGDSRFEFFFENLDRLPYRGPVDLFEHARTDPYVPDHVRHLTTAKTLSLRSPLESKGDPK
jgi:hypothetical protein